MNYYLDIVIKPDAELRLNILLNTLYTKLHKALCDLQASNIGVSFPNYQRTLGNTLRLHGSAQALANLQSLDWIGSLSGYCEKSEIRPIPTDVKFRTVSRRQPTMSLAKIRRLLKRGSITENEVKNYKRKMFTKGLDEPYVELLSGSNGYRHRRYIEFGPLLESPIEGEYDQFGLAKTTTIPWF